MPWRWVFTRRAERDLLALPVRDREAVSRALDRALADLGAGHLKKLGGRGNEWRLRVGRWRIRLDLDNANGVISVMRILPRGEAYRD
jgi:mRNA interferase RelE/StbE